MRCSRGSTQKPEPGTAVGAGNVCNPFRSDTDVGFGVIADQAEPQSMYPSVMAVVINTAFRRQGDEVLLRGGEDRMW